MEYFAKHKKQIFAVAIFQEFIKELASSLFAKELVANMIDSYEEAYLDDMRFECALEKFQDYQDSDLN